MLNRNKFQNNIILSEDARKEQSYKISYLSVQLPLNASDTSKNDDNSLIATEGR